MPVPIATRLISCPTMLPPYPTNFDLKNHTIRDPTRERSINQLQYAREAHEKAEIQAMWIKHFRGELLSAEQKEVLQSCTGYDKPSDEADAETKRATWEKQSRFLIRHLQFTEMIYDRSDRAEGIWRIPG